jgi:acyl carrier protein
MGGTALQSEVALSVLEQMLLANKSGCGVLEIDWSALRRFLPSSGHAKFSSLTRSFGLSTSDTHSGNSPLALAELTDAELQGVVAELLKQEVGQILRMQPDKIAVDRSLHDIGLDSLMGVELVTALESRFGIQLPVMALTEGPTINKLTQRIISHIRGTGQPDAAGDLQSQVAQMASMHATDVPEEVMHEIASGITTAAAERMID